ncbi:MAG: DedA family protein [Alicyclobacillaceae bacterium]|nr:DedA family protein [Alicyclobacillaceae bacterium]
MHFDVQHVIQQYGYAGIFFVVTFEMIGIPFPAETTLVASGVEWTQGVFRLPPLLLVASAGNVIGSTVAYGIGRFLGRPVILRLGRYVGITEKKLNDAEEKFERYRGFVVLFGKFIAGIRILIPYLAGINRMPFVLFSVYNAVSAVVWVAVFVILGRYLGVVWQRYHEALHQYLVPVIIVAVLLAGAGYAWRRHLRRRRGGR